MTGRARVQPGKLCIASLRWRLATAVVLLFSGAWTDAADPSPGEYEVKAALLRNFVQFIDWPSQSFAQSDSPLEVGVLGEDPFGSLLERIFEGESFDGHAVIVLRSDHLEDLVRCHLLFISTSEKERLSEILSRLDQQSVVTVGETDGFARRGGVINFYIEDNKVRFEINITVAEQKNLKISSQLLRRARIVS